MSRGTYGRPSSTCGWPGSSMIDDRGWRLYSDSGWARRRHLLLRWLWVLGAITVMATTIAVFDILEGGWFGWLILGLATLDALQFRRNLIIYRRLGGII